MLLMRINAKYATPVMNADLVRLVCARYGEVSGVGGWVWVGGRSVVSQWPSCPQRESECKVWHSGDEW